MNIYDTDDSFNFEKLVLTKPSLISGGNYFIRCLVNNNPLYIQPPKCKTKQGFTKAGKRFSCDLMFTNENENFIRWMENLENHCQQFIFKNRVKWFDGDMELHDIENYFTSPLKLYKSGKYYIARVNVNTVLNKPSLKIYDENENEVDMETINDNTNVVTIVEIQGIKCSSRSFQIEIELKQMMVLQPTNIFEKCIIKSSSVQPQKSIDNSTALVTSIINESTIGEPDIIVGKDKNDENDEKKDENDEIIENHETIEKDAEPIEEEKKETDISEQSVNDNNDMLPDVIDTTVISIQDGIEEIDFNLEELKEDDTIQIKKRNDVYYEMYREARRKAKIARDLALSSYLEAKRIKNTYMLNDIDDSDDSDLEMEEDNEEDEENSIDE
jgi:hypothetical protein